MQFGVTLSVTNRYLLPVALKDDRSEPSMTAQEINPINIPTIDIWPNQQDSSPAPAAVQASAVIVIIVIIKTTYVRRTCLHNKNITNETHRVILIKMN